MSRPRDASKHAAASLYGDLRRRSSHVGVSCLCQSYTKNSLVTNPDRYVAAPGVELSEAELELRREVGRKLAAHGLDPRIVGDLVADAVVEERFWVIPARESLVRVTQRASEIVEGRPPSLATT